MNTVKKNQGTERSSNLNPGLQGSRTKTGSLSTEANTHDVGGVTQSPKFQVLPGQDSSDGQVSTSPGDPSPGNRNWQLIQAKNDHSVLPWASHAHFSFYVSQVLGLCLAGTIGPSPTLTLKYVHLDIVCPTCSFYVESLLIYFIYFLKIIFIYWGRERKRTQVKEKQRERGSRLLSRCRTWCRVRSQDPGIKTLTKVRYLTNWAT